MNSLWLIVPMAMMTPFIPSLSKHDIGNIIMFEGACAKLLIWLAQHVT